MIEEGKYIYSIIQENENRSFGPIGINNREVKLVHYKPSTRAKLGAGPVPHRNEVSDAGDIAAVVSNTPIINFDRLDKKELIKYVATHQKVNEKIMKDYDIVPMAFGIIAPSSDEVSRILEKAYLQFKIALRKVTGKTEFVVQVWWDPKRVLEDLANTDPEIQELKQEISSKGGIFGMPIKLKLGRLVQKKTEARKQEYIKDTHTILNAITCDALCNKLIDEDMISNFSFLIEKNRESELDKKMQELGKKYEGKLRFKYVGPMPPYSFSNINLILGNFEIIDEARKLLGLGEEATFDEIKKAYHTLSHQYHPDKYGGEPTTSEKMKKINQSYSILKSYYQSCDELIGEKNQKYSFKKEDVENSLIIK